MGELGSAFSLAAKLIFSFDPDLWEIIILSLKVSVTSVIISACIGLPLGAFVGIARFPGRTAAIIVLNALMGLPPVVVGLLVYLAISNVGPFGWLDLLYTPWAMIIAQTVLITPIIAALSRQVLEDLHSEYDELFRSMNLGLFTKMRAVLWDARFSLATVVLAGFGRAVAEVGAVIIVGGNINHVTRVMTTAIALETSRGELALALALGIVLLVIALLVNAAVTTVRQAAAARAFI